MRYSCWWAHRLQLDSRDTDISWHLPSLIDIFPEQMISKAVSALWDPWWLQVMSETHHEKTPGSENGPTNKSTVQSVSTITGFFVSRRLLNCRETPRPGQGRRRRSSFCLIRQAVASDGRRVPQTVSFFIGHFDIRQNSILPAKQPHHGRRISVIWFDWRASIYSNIVSVIAIYSFWFSAFY